jgi:outer membrane protein assembly factor BamB
MKQAKHTHAVYWMLLAQAALIAAGGCDCNEGGVDKLDPALVIDPVSVDFGEVPLGVRVQAALTISNAGEAMLEAKAALVGDPIFARANNPLERLPPAGSDVLIIEATPTVLGEHKGVVRFQSDDPLSPTLDVNLFLIAVPVPPCDDGNPCTADAFDASVNDCAHEFTDGVACSPADKCITTAVCSQGVCLGTPKVCDDQSTCTRDFCRQTTGECIFLESADNCDDDNPCTADACVGNGCVHDALPSGSPCDDFDLCTVGDSCFAGECKGSGVPNGSTCDDHDSCTAQDTCLDGVCRGSSIIEPHAEGEEIFSYPLTVWDDAFLHRREVSLSNDGVMYGLDHLPLTNPEGLTHVVFAMHQCGTELYQFAYRPPDTHVLVRFVRREMQIDTDNTVRVVVGVRQLPDDGYRPETTTYLLDQDGNVKLSRIQTLGGENGRALLPDGSHIFGVIFPLTEGPPTPDMPAMQNLVVVREDNSGNVLWRHERSSWDWAEFLGVAGPRVLFWSEGRFGALDFNTGNTVWTAETAHITKEMSLSTALNLGVARATDQLIGVEILHGNQVFAFPATPDPSYVPRTDPVIAADGRVLVLMQRNNADSTVALGLDWVELDPTGAVMSTTSLPYVFPDDFGSTRHEDDPYPTVADDGVSYVGYGNMFWAIEPGGQVRWTLTAAEPNAYTGTVPLLRDDGVLLISESHRVVKGIRSNGGRMSETGWASFRHDNRRTNFTP